MKCSRPSRNCGWLTTKKEEAVAYALEGQVLSPLCWNHASLVAHQGGEVRLVRPGYAAGRRKHYQCSDDGTADPKGS